MTGKSKDLWASARERLSVVDRRQIVFDRQDNIELLQDVQCLTESARDQSIKKRWRFRRPDSGETIVLRDLFTKIVLWVTLFKQIGDVAVQYDPQHAALPWAGVRFILQVAVSDIVKFNFVVEGIETMSRMISRYAIFEDIYLRRPSVATEELQDALIGLYAAVLLYLSRTKSFFEQSTPKRMIKSVFIAEEEFQELSSQIAIEQSQADRSAAIVDKESHNDMNDTIDALAIDGSQRHAELLSLMHTIDGPITRMSGQVQGLEEHADNSQRTEILSWISAHPYMEHHEQIKKHILSGSGAWLLEDVVYTRWHKESACSLLWLHGKVGSGKSNLAAIVIEDAMKRAEAGQSPPPAYFYCSRNAAEPERSNPDAILASIVRQLSSVQSGFPLLSSIIEKYERKGRGFHSSGLRLEESRDIILELTEQYPMTTIIIDALDEIDSEKRQSLLETIENILQESIGLVKFFVSSRDDQDIVCALEVYPSLNLNSNKNQGDIEQFVRLETEKLVRKKRMLPYSKAKEELKTLIIEQVSHGADGMFRWASLQLEILCTLKLDADVRATLGRLPPKLEQLYLEIYEKQISRYNGEVGRSIISNTLKWLLYAQTRMRSSELCAAVGMNLAISPEDLAKEHILDLCHNFIIFDDGLDTFRFAHLSVREFLETRDEFSPIHCHVFAAEVCLLQLIGSTNSSIAEKFLKDECAIDVSGKTASAAEPLSEGLQNYATIYWSLHCSRIGEHGRESQIRFKKIFQFFLSTDLEGPSPLDAWLLSYRHRNYSDEAPYFLKTALDNYHSPLTTPFFLASAFGFCEVIRTCVMNPKLGLGERKTAWTISAFADQGEALKTLLENRGDLEIPESLVERMASSMDADKFAWLLDQVPDMKYTASLVASVANGLPDTRKEKLDILLHHFGLEKASNEILKAFAPYVTIDTFRTLLGRLDEELISAEVFERAASCQNVEVMTILAERKGFHLTTAAMAVAARGCNVQTVQLLLDRGGDSKITNSVIQQAATNGDEKVISLLLDHGGVINLETLTLASALGYAKVLRVLLQRGKAATRSMLRVGARNHRDGGAVMTLLLAEVKHDIIMEEMNELMKQAARNFNYAFEIMAQLLGQHEDITVTEDVLMAAAWSTSTGGPLLRLLLMNGMKTVLTIDVLEAFLTTLTSYDMIQPLLDRIGEIQAGEQLLEAAARNPLFGDELTKLLLEIIQVSEISISVWNAAVANEGCGVEVINLLESRFGKIVITGAIMTTAASKGVPRTMAFLLNRAGSTMITEDVLSSAAGRYTLYTDAMMRFLLEKAPDFPMTERLVNLAARYCSVENCLPLIWARSRQSKFSPALAQAAARDLGNFKFLLDETGDVEISEEVLVTVVSQNWQAIETLTMLLDRGIHFTVTPKVLIKAAENVHGPGPLVTYLLEHSNGVSVTEQVFSSIAASGNDEVLLILSKHCAMDGVPVMWTQISQLYCAAATWIYEYSYQQQSYVMIGFEQDACIEEVRSLLGQGVEPDLPDHRGSTPLARAAGCGNELIFKALLDAGANPSSKDQSGRTPLFCAAAGGHYNIVETLLGMGMEVDLKDENDNTPADAARKNAHMRIYRLLEKHSERGTPPSELSLCGLDLERA